MATTKTRTTKSRTATKTKADTGLLARTGRTVKQRPYVSAAIATGAVTAVAAAAAGAFFFSRKDKSFGEFTTQVKDGFAEASDKVRDRFAMEIGKRDNKPTVPVVEDKIKADAAAH
ncbi:MAG: hypothetical protein ABIP07_07640 [Sphingomicrobium sp.]